MHINKSPHRSLENTNLSIPQPQNLHEALCAIINQVVVIHVKYWFITHPSWISISKAHVIINIKSEVSTCPIVITFFRGCVSEMFVTSYFVTYCIYIPGKPGICFHYYCAVYDECKWSDTFGLKIVFVYLYITPSHYHHCANLSEDIELIKCLSYIFCRVGD